MPQPSDLEVRIMERDELHIAIGWAEQEGWNPGLADADCFHAADPSAPVFLDCPAPNCSATDLASRYGLALVSETARMYRGPAPDLPLSRIYGMTTFELG